MCGTKIDKNRSRQMLQILQKVEKPARYIGNEINIIEKYKKAELSTFTRFAFCFPDVYEIGMSHPGFQIMYYFINEKSNVYCERAFAPWADMESELRKNELKLFSLETWTPLNEFDFVGFTLQYELTYTNIINMLDLSGIPLYSHNRGPGDPIVCAGGPCAYNPEPLADFIDFFYIGEGEAALGDILDIYKTFDGSREDFLFKISTMDGVYVPWFYTVDYNISQRPIPDIAKCASRISVPELPEPCFVPESIQKVVVTDLDGSFFPKKQLLPLIEIVHDRVWLEIFRGCVRGCRFCQAGFVYRPVREKRFETLLAQAESLIASSGYEEISLVSLSTGDYTAFNELAKGLLERYNKDRVSISLPSLRIDAFTLDIMSRTQEVRKSSLTFAPEAGTQRLRDVINKGITEDEILSGCELAFRGGWNRVKLYFMIGLPTETDEDLLGIVKLAEKIVDLYYKSGNKKRPPEIVVSTSCFSPKPFTPFQWERQCSYTEFINKHMFIKKAFRNRHIKYNFNDARMSVLEGLIARGDRRVGAALHRVWELGARFDGWSDQFNDDKEPNRMAVWERALAETGIALDYYSRELEPDNALPWDHIDVGVTKEYLQKEREKAYLPEITMNCREKCNNCGVICFGGGICVER